MQELCKFCSITKSRTTPYNPECNSQCKCFNRTLHNLLRTLALARRRNGLIICSTCAMPIMQLPSHPRATSPFYLLFGRDARLPVDLVLGEAPESEQGNVDDWLGI